MKSNVKMIAWLLWHSYYHNHCGVAIKQKCEKRQHPSSFMHSPSSIALCCMHGAKWRWKKHEALKGQKVFTLGFFDHASSGPNLPILGIYEWKI
ncbi:unnamed protein product [Sphenostylis stenocarpa]|uniref:Uncharacterized protein n=1 Tax=Sphenostylis stenocarpa TaxID=92480 RepID=A0AA86T470_9FABA|nr:unnamed protein product [Sphenostylis stenocarpa]